MRWKVKTISTWGNSSRPFKQSGANLDESSSIREVTPPHTSSRGSRIGLWTIPTAVKVKCEGGEYNVVRRLMRCFGMESAIVTAFASDPVGRLLQDLIYQGGVDQSLVRWVEHDGVGHAARNGLNFTERGFGVRAAVGSYDR